MPRLSYFGCAALVACLVLTTPLSAQQGRRGGFGNLGGRDGVPSPIALLADESVQKEVGITDDQKAKLASLREELTKEVGKVRTAAGITDGAGGGANLSEEQWTKLTEAMKKLFDSFAPKLKETLKPEQLERVQQIVYQFAGPNAYTNSDVIKALDITKEQQEKIATVTKDFQEKIRALGGAAGGNREAFTKLRDERAAALAKILTPEQTEKFAKLKGKPFDVSTIQLGGRGGDKKKAD